MSISGGVGDGNMKRLCIFWTTVLVLFTLPLASATFDPYILVIYNFIFIRKVLIFEQYFNLFNKKWGLQNRLACN